MVIDNSVFELAKGKLVRQANYFVKQGYQSRDTVEYFFPVPSSVCHRLHQPHVYPLAFFLARRLGCETIIDIGSGIGEKLAHAHPEFKIIGFDYGQNLATCREQFPFGEWNEWDIDRQPRPRLSREMLRKSIIICADVIEHLRFPENMLAALRQWLTYAPMAVLSTPERDLANGLQDMGPPANQYHIREWNTDELRRLLGFYDLNVDRIGLTQNNTELQQKTRMLALLNGEAVVKHLSSDAPPVFRVVAIIATYNDEPIIEPILKGMIHQGVEIHIVDNWSTDKTWEICNRLREENRQIIGLERFPEAPPTDYMWQEILHRKAQLAHEIDADWFIHCDSDEIRMSPWPDKNLREAIYQVDTEGYNAIDFTMLVFYPTTPDEYPSGASPEGQLQYFDFGHRPGHFLRINAWKKQPEKVNLAEGGGHNVQFSGRRLYPYKFLTKHYSVLSQSHGEKKILLDRLPRTEREFTQRSAHTHLRLYKPGHIFYRDPQSLHRFDDDFYKEFLVEAISGVGVYEDPQST